MISSELNCFGVTKKMTFLYTVHLPTSGWDVLMFNMGVWASMTSVTCGQHKRQQQLSLHHLSLRVLSLT